MQFIESQADPQSVIHVVDPQVEAGLKQIQSLLDNLAEQKSAKAEIEKLISDFNIRHQQECGRLIVKLLTLKKDHYKAQAKQDFTWEKAYDEASKAFHDYQKIFDAAQVESLWSLTEEEQQELKEIFRKASKCCHPDLVDDGLQEEAGATFHELKTAYNQNDLNRVREIWESLEQGDPVNSSSQFGNDLTKIQFEISRLRSQISSIANGLQEMRSSAAFIQMIIIDDWDAYFEEKRQQLNLEIENLENSLA